MIEVRDNVNQVLRWLESLPRAIASRALAPAKRDVGLLVQKESRRRAPFLEGDLENSITYEVLSTGVRMLVPLNSPAGQYAEVQHEHKHNPGPGTRQKPGAGMKFISRAVDENQDRIVNVIGSRMDIAQLDK